MYLKVQTNLLRLIAFLMLSFLSSQVNAQILTTPTGDRDNLDYKVRLAKKRLKYNLKKENFIFTVKLKKGQEVSANSDIFPDPSTNSNFLYYREADSVMKIYAAETEQIKGILPVNGNKAHYVGIPQDGKWRFLIADGKMKAYTYFVKANPVINEIEIDNQSIPFPSQKIEELFKERQKAYEAYLNKDYLKAVKAFNKN